MKMISPKRTSVLALTWLTYILEREYNPLKKLLLPLKITLLEH